MNRYQAVFFDLDGTLADTDLMIVMTMLEIYKQYKPEHMPTLSELLSFSGPTLQDSMKKHFSDTNTMLLVNVFRELSPKYYDKYVVLFPYVKNMLKELKSLGIKIAVVTSKARQATILTFKHLGLDNIFDDIVCVDDVKNPKPDPEGINSLLNKYRLKQKDVLFVGDTIADYLASEASGVDCAMVGWAIRGVPEAAKPKYVLKDYTVLKEIVKHG